MADRGGGDGNTTERVSAVTKRRRNLSNKAGGDRLRNAHSKSPRRRPGTPEPERRTFSDDSEKEVSDVEVSKTRSARAVDRSEIIKRTRSKERPPKKDTTTEIEDDFEIIRQMHKSKELEEEITVARVEKEDAVHKVKELKQFEVKEMPAFIEAPEESKKRARPKTLPLKEEVPIVKPRSRSRSKPRKPSTSEEEDEVALALKGKMILRPKRDEVKNELRKRRIAKKKSAESEVIDPEPVKVEDPPHEDEPEMSGKDDVKDSKQWFFQRWFSQNEKENVEEQVQVNQDTEMAPEPVEEPKPDLDLEPEVEPEPESEPEEEEEEAGPADQDSAVKLPGERKWLIRRLFGEWGEFVEEHRNEYNKIKVQRNRCISSLTLILLFCGCGGFIFRFTEGAFESFYKCGVKRVKRDFIDSLWGYSQYMPMEDWKGQARRKLMDFENELHAAHEAGMTSYSGQKSWSFLNAVVYSLTVVTTIGYGHISPSTATGRAITIVYAIIGIPMFLILLADFGKLFTRGIKFLWAFVRRVYYTGSCKKARRTGPVHELMKGAQLVYDFARRSSQMPPEGQVGQQAEIQQNFLKPPEVGIAGLPDSPETPAPSQFEVDDEFNLPISVAITILIIYIFIGATIYCMWEEWTFFESFYFVFISMSTIGFGDYVPHHPMYMMASMVYLVFGLALTSMCINVVQEKLSDTFRQASSKIGATIGLHMAEEDITVETAPAELADTMPEIRVPYED